MSGFKYEKNKDNIVTITMDMTGPVNTVNEEFVNLMTEYVDRLEKEKEDIAGVIFTSAKSTFLAGGDLEFILSFNEGDEEKAYAFIEKTKSNLRRLEKLGKPVVAAINGSALGGGCELGLACHHRVAINSPKSEIGMPEVSLGLLPGAGGIVRTVRKLGFQNAMPLVLEGRRLRPEKALKAGLIDELADDAEEMMAKAVKWIKENPEAVQPWDVKGYKIPGGDARSKGVLQTLMAASPMLFKKTKGVMPAPEKILAVAAESLRVDFDTALKIESRGLVSLALTPEAKNMINTFFFQLNELNGGGSRPKGIEKQKVKKVGILGAGMMGQGIAYVSAKVGIEVVLKDISQEAAEKGKSYSEKICDKLISKGRMDEAKKKAFLDRIKATVDDSDLEGCDLIVEAVFEDMALKKKVFAETEKYLTDGGIYGSNTSTLPITELANGVEKPENFIGIHFFSPVDKMPLVEIITGEKTSDEILARTFDYCQQIKKVPIVVNDGRGFFTSRVFTSYIDEGCRLLREGVAAPLIDRLGRYTGMMVGPLTVFDEVSQALSKHLSATNQELDDARGENFNGKREAANEVGARMVDEFNRGGRAHGGGFYEYPEGAPKYFWPKLKDIYENPDLDMPHQDIKDRLIFRQVIEALDSVEEGVLTAVRDGNIGSIMGIGFAPQTGGVFQYINTYGIENFIQRTVELQEKYGERFTPPEILKEKAKTGAAFV